MKILFNYYNLRSCQWLAKTFYVAMICELSAVFQISYRYLEQVLGVFNFTEHPHLFMPVWSLRRRLPIWTWWVPNLKEQFFFHDVTRNEVKQTVYPLLCRSRISVVIIKMTTFFLRTYYEFRHFLRHLNALYARHVYTYITRHSSV